jgi:hypothetical protein
MTALSVGELTHLLAHGMRTSWACGDGDVEELRSAIWKLHRSTLLSVTADAVHALACYGDGRVALAPNHTGTPAKRLESQACRDFHASHAKFLARKESIFLGDNVIDNNGLEVGRAVFATLPEADATQILQRSRAYVAEAAAKVVVFTIPAVEVYHIHSEQPYTSLSGYPITSEQFKYDLVLKTHVPPSSNMVCAISLILEDSESSFQF